MRGGKVQEAKGPEVRSQTSEVSLFFCFYLGSPRITSDELGWLGTAKPVINKTQVLFTSWLFLCMFHVRLVAARPEDSGKWIINKTWVLFISWFFLYIRSRLHLTGEPSMIVLIRVNPCSPVVYSLSSADLAFSLSTLRSTATEDGQPSAFPLSPPRSGPFSR